MILSSSSSSGAASQHPLRMAAGARSPPMTSTAARTEVLRGSCWRARSGLIRLDREGELGVDVTAVLARGVRELGVAALGASDVVDRLERQVGAALALARLAVLLDRKHDGLLPGPATLQQGWRARPRAGRLTIVRGSSGTGPRENNGRTP